MNRKLFGKLFLVLPVALAGCAGAPVATVVKVPVPIACQETIPDRPAMPTEDFKTRPTLDQFAQAAMAELERREGFEQQLVAALTACTAPISK